MNRARKLFKEYKKAIELRIDEENKEQMQLGAYETLVELAKKRGWIKDDEKHHD